MSGKSEQNISLKITYIQKILLYILLSILPIAILPFPWDLTEKGMTIALFLFALLIGALELVKIIWSGKLLFLKRDSDLLVFLLLISFILTTLFAQDTNLSLFGYDYRLSSGLLGIGTILLLTFITRSILTTKKDILNLFNALLIGSILTTILSLISLFGVDIFNMIPKIGIVGKDGFPTLGSPVILLIYNCIAVLVAYISLYMLKGESKEIESRWFAVVAIFVNSISLIIFSMDKRSFLVSMLFTLTWILVLVALFLKDRKLNLKTKINKVVLPASILVFTSLAQIPAIQRFLLPNDRIPSPLNLSLDASWQVVSQSLMRSLKNGIIGLGLDSFGVIFTSLKPVEWININMVSSHNEILTSLSSGGFLWLVIWFLLGWYILKDLVADIKRYKEKSRAVIFFDTLLLFIYLTSFLTTYTLLLRFIFFLALSVGVIIRNLYNQQEVDNLLLKMWTMGTGKKDPQSFPLISTFFTVIIAILVIMGVWKLGEITLSSLYLLRAESYISNENEKIGDREPTKEEEREITKNLYNWYSNSLKYDRGNPLTNRKASIVAVDRLGVLMGEYKDTNDEEILNRAVSLRNEAFEFSKTAINLAPSLYAGYNSRALVYLGVINLGYTEYVRDGISVIDEAIDMKPLDYQNYYNKAQLYYLLQNYKLALNSSTQALSIKGDYVPALILSANINGVQGQTEIQLSYLQAAKTVLEQNDLQDIELYDDISEQIDSIKQEEETTQEERIESIEDDPEKEL